MGQCTLQPFIALFQLLFPPFELISGLFKCQQNYYFEVGNNHKKQVVD